MVNYTNEELLSTPLDNVRNMIRMNAMVAQGMQGLLSAIDQGNDDEILDVINNWQSSSNDSVSNLNGASKVRMMTIRNPNLFATAGLQTTDPSAIYEIKHENKIGEGGFAKVFKVTRKEDGLVCALKFCDVSDESDRNMIVNEIGLMNQC